MKRGQKVRRFTETEDKLLRQIWRMLLPMKTLCELLSHSETSIEWRAHKLGLPKRGAVKQAVVSEIIKRFKREE